MYEIGYYQTSGGAIPFKKYLSDLLKQHKQAAVNQILIYLNMLEEYGPTINEHFAPNASKPIRNGIFELRPSASRIFYFFFEDNKIIVLHGWEKKRNTTDNNEIEKAIREKKEWERSRQ